MPRATQGPEKPSTFWWVWPYQIFLVLGSLWIFLVRALRGRELPNWRQRLGWYPEGLTQRLARLREPIWLHTVSVGEALAARPFIEAMRRRLPDRDWVITTVTPAGQRVAQALLRPGRDQLLYLPLDVQPAVSRALRAISPSFFIAFETELWPVLFFQLRKRGVPIVVVNGRISPRAWKRYRWIRFLMEGILAQAQLILAQSPQDARRFAALGAPKDRIVVAGNIKWDLGSDGQASSANLSFRELFGLKPGEILWTAGSTHPPEERMLLEVYRQLKPEFPFLRLLIAPRHLERIPEVEQEVEKVGLVSVRRTTHSPTTDSPIPDPIILLDTLGELAQVYSASDLVFVGGSLVPRGGHNLVEPAACARPILTGPHLENFQAMAESLAQAGGVWIVPSTKELKDRLSSLLRNPAARQDLGRRAQRAIEEHRGATERTAALVLKVIS